MKTNIKQIISGTITALTFPINSVQEHLLSSAFPAHPTQPSDPPIAQEQQLSPTQAHVTEELRLKALIVDLEKHLMEEIEYKKILAELPQKLTILNDERRVLKERINAHRQEITNLYKEIKTSADFTFAVDTSMYQETEARKPIALAIVNLLSNIDTPNEDQNSMFIDESIKEQQATNQTVAQFSIIKAIINQLQQDINHLKCPTDKKRLLELKEQQETLLAKLQEQLHLNAIECTIDLSQRSLSLKKLKANLECEQEIGTTIRPKLIELHIEITQFLETKKSQNEQHELLQRTLEVTTALDECTSKINELQLTEEQRDHLLVQFNECQDPCLLIAEHRNKIHSILNVKEWAPSLVLNNRKEYINTQNENKLAYDFFTRYQEKIKLLALKNQLSTQLEQYENLPPCTNTETETEERKYVERIRKLLIRFSACKVSEHFPASPQAQNYYDLLPENMSIIDHRMSVNSELLLRIEALIPIVTEIEELRTIHNLPEDQDNLLQPLTEYISVLPPGLILDEKIKLSEQFNVYINGSNGIKNKLNQLVAALKQIKAIEQQQFDIKSQIEEEKRTLKKIDSQEKEISFQQKSLGYALEQKSLLQIEDTFAVQIEKNTKKLAELQAIISAQGQTESSLDVVPIIAFMEEDDTIHVDKDKDILPPQESAPVTCELPLPPIVPDAVHQELPDQHSTIVPFIPIPIVSNPAQASEVNIINTPVPPPLIIESPHRAELAQLISWHQLNTALLEHHAPELKNWYKQVYDVAEQATQQASYSNQYSHIIRDIYFELTHKRDVSIIQAYKRICPNPRINLDALLTLKPNYSLIKPPFDNADIGAFPPQLQNLYCHYLKLKPNYPMEAELLLQATQALYCAYQAKTNNPSAGIDVPRITQDSRFVPLKRHRGLGIIWELIEDFFHFLIGKMTGKAAYEYVKTPCFFNTRSYSLMKNADSFVKETLVEPRMV